MSKRTKFWLRALAIAGGVFAFLLLIYCYLAFAPSGYEKFERENAGAVERVQVIVSQWRPAPARSDMSSTPDPGESLPETQGETDEPDFLDRLDGLNDRFMDDRGYLLFNGRLFPPNDYVSVDVEKYGLNTPGEPGEWPKDIAEALRKDFLWAVKESLVFGHDWESDYLRASQDDARPESMSQNPFRSSLPEYLDEVESLLLKDEWNIPDYNMSIQELYRGGLYGAVRWFFPLTVLRASMQDDREKASRLFARVFQAISTCSLLTFPYIDSDSWETWLRFVAHPAIPRQGLVEALKSLDRLQLTPEQAADLRTAWVMRSRGQWGGTTGNVNDWGSGVFLYMFDGALSRAARGVLQPVGKRALDRASIALARGDGKECEKDLGFAAFCFSGGFSTWRGGDYFERVDFDRISERFNQFRLVLQAGIHWRDTGHWPDSFLDTLPDSFSDLLRGEPDRYWAIYRLPAFRGPKIAMPHADNDFRVAAYDFIREHKRFPESLEDIAPFWKSRGGGQAPQGVFRDFNETPVVVEFYQWENGDIGTAYAYFPQQPLVAEDRLHWLYHPGDAPDLESVE